MIQIKFFQTLFVCFTAAVESFVPALIVSIIVLLILYFQIKLNTNMHICILPFDRAFKDSRCISHTVL